MKFEKRFPYDVSTIVNGILGSLVSITCKYNFVTLSCLTPVFVLCSPSLSLSISLSFTLSSLCVPLRHFSVSVHSIFLPFPAICTLCQPWEAFIIGVIGAIITVPTEMILRKLKIDDPIGVIPVHAVCAIWGLIAVGRRRSDHGLTIVAPSEQVSTFICVFSHYSCAISCMHALTSTETY